MGGRDGMMKGGRERGRKAEREGEKELEIGGYCEIKTLCFVLHTGQLCIKMSATTAG